LDPIVSTGWLAEHAGDPGLRVVDVRWYLDPSKKGREQYLAGHIPGATFLDVDADLSAPGGGGATPGRLQSRSRTSWDAPASATA
jgi:thiosulfate/3-mercaptopyruvate sulfurtransferase